MGKQTQKEKQERLPESNDFELLKKSIEEKKKQGDIEGLDTLLNEVKNNNQLTERQKKILNKQCENAQKEIQTQIESEAANLKKSIQREQITATADNNNTTEPPQDKKEMSLREKCKNRWWGLNNTEKTWAVTGAVVSGGILIRAASKLFWGKKKEEDKKKEEEDTKNKEEHRYNKWRGKLGIWAWIAWITLPFMPDSFKTTLTGFALTCKDKVRDAWYRITGKENEKPLNVKESFTDATTHFMNTKHYDNIPVTLKFDYNEQTQTVKAFWYEVKVDIKNHIETSRIDWLDLKFKTYQELFETAFLIWFLKYLFKGKCLPNVNNAYFSLNSKSWDIDVNLDKEWVEEAVSGSWNQITSLCLWGSFTLTTLVAALTKNMWASVWTAALTLVASVLWGAYMEWNNFLHDHCASIDNKNGKKRLINYLNNMKWWANGNQDFSDIHDSKIKDEVITIWEEIAGTKTSETRWSERGIDAIQDPNNPNHLTLQSYWNEVSITIDDSDSQNKKLSIEWLSVTFPLKEGIRFANLVNYFKKSYPQWHLKSDEDSHDNLLYNYFYYDNKFWKKGIFTNVDGVFDMDDRVLEDSPDNNQPGQFQTFFQNKDACLSYINHLTIAWWRSIRAKDTVNLQFPEHSGWSRWY